MTLAIAAIVVWIGLWALNVMLARWLPERQARIVVPIVFGLTLVLVVELLVTGLKVPFVILPSPREWPGCSPACPCCGNWRRRSSRAR